MRTGTARKTGGVSGAGIEFASWLIDRRILELLAESDQLSGANYELARARKMEADACLSELAVQRERGIMAPVETMERIMVRANLIVRTRLLAVPAQLAAELPDANRSEVFTISQRIIYDALTQLVDTEMPRDLFEDDTE